MDQENAQLAIIACQTSVREAVDIYERMFGRVGCGSSNQVPATNEKDSIKLNALTTAQAEYAVNLAGHLISIKTNVEIVSRLSLRLTASEDDVKAICCDEIFRLRKQLLRETKKSALLRDLLVNELNRSEHIDTELGNKQDQIVELKKSNQDLKRKCEHLESELKSKKTAVEKSIAIEFDEVEGVETKQELIHLKPEPKPSLINCFITKKFSGYGYFVGIVTSYRSPYYRVAYEDGDVEDLDRSSVLNFYVDEKNVREERRRLCRMVRDQVLKDGHGDSISSAPAQNV
jgi:hypothetical protein